MAGHVAPTVPVRSAFSQPSQERPKAKKGVWPIPPATNIAVPSGGGPNPFPSGPQTAICSLWPSERARRCPPDDQIHDVECLGLAGGVECDVVEGERTAQQGVGRSVWGLGGSSRIGRAGSLGPAQRHPGEVERYRGQSPRSRRSESCGESRPNSRAHECRFMHSRRRCQVAGRERLVSSFAVSGRSVVALAEGVFCGRARGRIAEPETVWGCKSRPMIRRLAGGGAGEVCDWPVGVSLPGGRFRRREIRPGGDPVASGLVVPEGRGARREPTSVRGDRVGWD